MQSKSEDCLAAEVSRRFRLQETLKRRLARHGKPDICNTISISLQGRSPRKVQRSPVPRAPMMNRHSEQNSDFPVGGDCVVVDASNSNRSTVHKSSLQGKLSVNFSTETGDLQH